MKRMSATSWLIGMSVCVISACSTAPQMDASQISQACTVADKIVPESTKFLDMVWPSPGDTLVAATYRQRLSNQSPHYRGVGIALWRDIDNPPDTAISGLIKRATLFVDGQAITNGTLAVTDGLTVRKEYDQIGTLLNSVETGPLYLSWVPELGPGEHLAKFVIKTNSGEILHFTWCFTLITNEIIKANQERASEIISALARYALDHGEFPGQLDSLVPTYLAQILATESGRSFEYERDTLEGYYLIFQVDGDKSLACGYNQRLKGWDCSRGD